jgi:hypothetical protein
VEPFRDDLREPKVLFGRCCITGEWGKVIGIDLGDISLEAPDTENGVLFENGKVTFTKANPIILNSQATFSRDGLEKLMAYLDSQDNPIPSITPELVYKWHVLYTNGAGISQFVSDQNTYETVEIPSGDIDFSRLRQISVVPNFPAVARAQGLPTFSFVKEKGTFYQGGQELDVMFNGEYDPESSVVYARKVNITFGSQMEPNGLDRNITGAYTSVLQLLGWKVGGLTGPGPGCIIAIDERGHWRPYEYSE